MSTQRYSKVESMSLARGRCSRVIGGLHGGNGVTHVIDVESDALRESGRRVRDALRVPGTATER